MRYQGDGIMLRVQTAADTSEPDLKFGECLDYPAETQTSPLHVPLNPARAVSPGAVPTDQHGREDKSAQTFRFMTFNFLHRGSEVETNRIPEISPVSLVC